MKEKIKDILKKMTSVLKNTFSESDEKNKKEKIKNILKKLADFEADALSGKDVEPVLGRTLEETGEKIKTKKIDRKEKPEEKPKKPEEEKPGEKPNV